MCAPGDGGSEGGWACGRGAECRLVVQGLQFEMIALENGLAGMEDLDLDRCA